MPDNINHPDNTSHPDNNDPSDTARSETARANGAMSHGPVTPEGRARSSQNSLRHGLTAEAVVLVTESQEEFQFLLDSFLDRFRPADGVELELVEAMAAARWRLRRLLAIETRIFEIETLRRGDSLDREFKPIDDYDRLANAFQHLADNDRSLVVLSRYESTLNRTFDRALKQLTQLQSAPRPGAAKHVGSFRNSPDPPSRDLPDPCPAVPVCEPASEPILPSSGAPSPSRSGAASGAISVGRFS